VQTLTVNRFHRGLNRPLSIKMAPTSGRPRAPRGGRAPVLAHAAMPKQREGRALLSLVLTLALSHLARSHARQSDSSVVPPLPSHRWPR
jgi:hypothetical protein